MNETTFTRQVMQNWQRQKPNSLWFHKIADPTYGQAYTQTRAVDVIACYKGKVVGIEWKLIKNKKSIPLDRIRESQIKTLFDIKLVGGFGFIAIGVYNSTKDKSVYFIPIQDWCKAVKKEKKKSIKLSVFDKFKTTMIQVGQYKHWDMSYVELLLEGK